MQSARLSLEEKTGCSREARKEPEVPASCILSLRTQSLAVLFLTTISDVFLNRRPTLMRTPTGQSSCPGISRLLLGKIWASGDFFDGYQILACFDGYKQIVFKFRTFLEYLVKFFRKDYQNLSYQPQQDIFCYKYRKTQFVPIQHNCLFHLQPQYHQ